ncbi:hypothetical protein AMECASPLE_034933, partial [Ameca splendens]
SGRNQHGAKSEAVAVLKENNIRRHYETKHPAASQYKGDARKNKTAELLVKLRPQQGTFTRLSIEKCPMMQHGQKSLFGGVTRCLCGFHIQKVGLTVGLLYRTNITSKDD